MTLQQSIEEAKTLKDFTNKITEVIHLMPKFNESEVNLRVETLRGFMIILNNDIFEMIQQWHEEENL